jgi:hypothetical protein
MKKETVEIKAPNFQTAVFELIGTTPYVQHAWGEKARKIMMETQEGGQKQGKKKKEARDFVEEYMAAFHQTTSGRHGIPAVAFRAAMLSACRAAGYTMKLAKQAIVNIDHDEISTDGMGLIYIEGTPKRDIRAVRIGQGQTNLAVRPMWMPGWRVTLRVKFDADMLKLQDIAHLVMRAGTQVGVGEGRPDSKTADGPGLEWGKFEVVN